MKKLLILLFFLCACWAYSQSKQKISGDNIGLIKKALQYKPQNYFTLKNEILENKYLSTEEAEDFYEKAKQEGYIIGQIYALNSIGNHYRNQSRYKKAVQEHEKAAKLSNQIGNIEAEIVSLNSLGVCYRRQNDLKSALDYHQKALTLSRRVLSQSKNLLKSIAIAENNIGNIYISLKQFKLAIDELKSSVIKKEKLNDEKGLAITYDNIGYAYEKLDNLDLAIKNYNQSLYYNKRINSKVGKIICNNRISGVLIKKGEYKKALNIITKTYNDVSLLKDQYYVVQTLSSLGWAQLKNKEYDKAEKNLLKSIELSERYELKADYFVESCLRLSELYEEKQEYEKAHFYYKEGKEQDEKTTGVQNILYVSNILSKYKLQEQESQIRDLKNRDQLHKYENSRNRNVLIITLVSLALLSVALYSIYRQRLLNNDRRVLMLEQQALQAQMNPHFIFNALNSIKLYIINNDQRQAVYYLNKFSKLIRNILDVSKIKEVSLEEELKTMELYMSIENIRFNNDIEYLQKINTNLNLDTIKIPPLALQPFLENAIWHGLSSKKGKKTVVLSAFKVSKNLIEISIADNGIGREAAMKIKKGKNASLKRKSIGIELTKERLKTFANDFMHDFSLKYYDLKDESGNPAGTKVALRIPLRQK